ncbi:hypothetical protein PsYK624_089970 [Phanerochaete sordida]|uniref:Uncharacterized protein n=1 Tax=Phanerochaete sordida TaxID=48140 RepID=A0A9P3GFN3_9APHY|nr:hypothetical protein PsYK624_089970 [Phanerochaete sordida]
MRLKTSEAQSGRFLESSCVNVAYCPRQFANEDYFPPRAVRFVSRQRKAYPTGIAYICQARLVTFATA